MKVIDIYEGKRKQEGDWWIQTPEKKLPNQQREKLLRKQERGYEHTRRILTQRELYVLNQARAKGWIFNDHDKKWWHLSDEEKKKTTMVDPIVYTGLYWYYWKDSPHIENIKKLTEWMKKAKSKYNELEDLSAKTQRRLKGLRSARTRMGSY